MSISNPSCVLTDTQIQEAFLAAPPLIQQQILDLTIKHPSWLRDLFPISEWPAGNGTVMQQLVFRGAMPPIERGFDNWSKQTNNTGCDPCTGPNCAYHWTAFGGNGFERKTTELMSREFRSPSYCIKEIQTTAHFMEVFAKIVENLYAQIDFFKEINIGQNVLTGLAKKFVVDSGGAKPNRQNPYVYRNTGTARLSMLNIELLEFFYEYMRRIPDAVPFDVVNGSPVFSIIASHQLLARLYRDDPNLRQDVRFSGLANDLLSKYNFMSTIRGMFIAAPVLYPRRFNLVNGDPVEVLPFVNDIPMEIGSFTGMNPAYEAATHEEVILHGKYPFKLFFMPTQTTLGENTSFGPEFSFMNNWMWVNPMTSEDPFRRVGYFATSAQIGISQQFSDAIFAILVERPKVTLMGAWLPEAPCPPTPVDCDNEVPAVGCPCPIVTAVIPNPITAGNYFVTFALGLDVAADDTVQLGTSTGGYVTGTVESVNADGTVVEFSFTQTIVCAADFFTTVYCDSTLGCYAEVEAYNPNCTDNTRADLVLSNPIKADTNADTVTVYFGDGTNSSATVVGTPNMATLVWTVDFGSTVFCDNKGGVIAICVPPGTDGSCGACGGPVVTACVT